MIHFVAHIPLAKDKVIKVVKGFMSGMLAFNHTVKRSVYAKSIQ